jgi:tetratricopeptide (TPR) repeat protein
LALAGESLTRAKTTAYQMNVPSLKADVEKNFANFYLDQGMIEKGREALELAEGFCTHAEAFETQSEICLARTRYNLLTLNLSAAHVSLKHGLALSDTYGFSRLNPLFDLCRGELLLMEGKIDEAEACFREALAFAKKHEYRYLFMKAPLGFLQIQLARKQLKKNHDVFGPLEKAVKSWGARKLRAKFLAVRAIANTRAQGTPDMALIRQCLLILDMGGFLLTKLQFLEVFEDMAEKIGDAQAVKNFQIQREQLLRRAPPELRNIPSRKSVIATIPISLVS